VDKRITLGIKLAIAVGFIISIVSFFMIFIDLNPINIERALSGVDIIKLPEAMKEHSSTLNIISLFAPGLIASVEDALMIISRCLIAINIISFLGAFLTLVLRKIKGFVAAISTVAINIAILAFVYLRSSGEVNNLKEAIGDTLDKFMSLIGGNLSFTGNVEAGEMLGSGVKLWLAAQGLVFLLSIIGLIFKERQEAKKTA